MMSCYEIKLFFFSYWVVSKNIKSYFFFVPGNKYFVFWVNLDSFCPQHITCKTLVVFNLNNRMCSYRVKC